MLTSVQRVFSLLSPACLLWTTTQTRWVLTDETSTQLSSVFMAVIRVIFMNVCVKGEHNAHETEDCQNKTGSTNTESKTKTHGMVRDRRENTDVCTTAKAERHRAGTTELKRHGHRTRTVTNTKMGQRPRTVTSCTQSGRAFHSLLKSFLFYCTHV